MREIQAIAIALCFVAFMACGDGNKPSPQATGDTIKFKYARLLQMVSYDGYVEVNVSSPWNKGKLLQKYILVSRDCNDLSQLPQGTIVRVPLRRVITFSVVHAGLMVELGATDAIAGIADLQYVRNPFILKRCTSGKISDIGNSMSPNVEKVIDAAPDAMFVSPFENAGGYGKLEGTGIPLIECADYMEATALGRAEWMKFYGMLLGYGQVADSLFSVVDSSYQALKALAASSNARRSIIMDKKTGAVWYVPGGHSTIGTMLSDANAVYPFSGNGDAGSLALPFETVLEMSGDADIWAFRYGGDEPASYDVLASEYHGYCQMRAFRERNCYGCNVDQTRFYEETPFRPDYLLGDFVQMVHPEIKLKVGMRYFAPVVDK